MAPIKSIFEQISTEVFQMRDLQQMKTFVIEFVKEKNIKEEDKTKILQEVYKASTVYAFQRYICNALLKYEGMGIDKIVKPKKEKTNEPTGEN